MFTNALGLSWQTLAQGNDADEWINILFIVVVAVFWAIGGIVKAAGAGRRAQQKQNKGSSQPPGPKRETWLQQLTRKVEELQQTMQGQETSPRQRSRQPARRESPPAKPPGGQVTVRMRPDGESVLVYERQPATTPRPQPQQVAQQRRDERTQPTRARLQREQAARRRRAALKAAMPEPPIVPKPTPSPQPLGRKNVEPATVPAAPLVDYSDPNTLRRAVLDYEILGKPLSLRDPFERTGSF